MRESAPALVGASSLRLPQQSVLPCGSVKRNYWRKTFKPTLELLWGRWIGAAASCLVQDLKDPKEGAPALQRNKMGSEKR